MEHFSYQRKSIAVYTGTCDSDQGIARFDILSGDQIFSVNYAHCKSSQVVLILRHQPRMLCSFTTDQSSSGLFTALCHTTYDSCDLLRIILAAGNIVKEEQRFTACTCHIVHTHGNRINTDGIMFIQKKCKLYFGSTSVGSGQQYRIFHILNSFQ